MAIFVPIFRFKVENRKLIVEEDSMTSVSEFNGQIKRTFTKSIHKGKIRTIFEIKRQSDNLSGIGVAERGEFAARMLGFVFIPKSLPEFEELKH